MELDGNIYGEISRQGRILLSLGTNVVTNLTVRLVATGDNLSLSSPLYLLRWAPRVEFLEDGKVSVLSGEDKPTVVAVSRNRDSGMFRIPVRLDWSDFPCFFGSAYYEAMPFDELCAPPVRGLDLEVDRDSMTGCLSTPDPLWTELPSAGTGFPVRVCCYEVSVSGGGMIGSGPRPTRFDSPYPLTSPSARRAYRRALRGTDPANNVTLRLSPACPSVGFLSDRKASRAIRLLAEPSSPTNPPTTENPYTTSYPYSVTPWFDPHPGEPITDTTPCSDEDSEESSDEDDSGGCDDDGGEDCECGDDDTLGAAGGTLSQCSFRLRIPLGRPAADALSGYLWTLIDRPTAVHPGVFNILGTPSVSSATNAAGDFSVVCSSDGGKSLYVSRIAHGASIAVSNASGRLECRWEVWNEYGDANVVRARRLTVLGNATEDVRYTLHDDMYAVGGVSFASRVSGIEPSVCGVRDDLLRSVRTVKWKWRTDADEPDFVTDVLDEKMLDGTLVAAVMSEFVKVGVGSMARRRLSRRHGYDENGGIDERRTYWCDGESRFRHARLKSVESNRMPWSFHDYDSRGREIVRIEQLDGSPFPGDLPVVSHLADLPAGCSARATVTSYLPLPGDRGHRNDAMHPRTVTTYVLRGGAPPLLVGTETWTYARSVDAAGNPFRVCTHAVAYGSAPVDAPMVDVRVEYPDDDYAVPVHLRGLVVSETDPGGVVDETRYVRGTWDARTRSFAPSGSGAHLWAETTRSRAGTSARTYTVAVTEVVRRLVVHEEERLASDDAVLSWTSSFHDDVGRLRLRAYSDGTFETNAYSCCRLLWSRDRRGRKTLRSAQTGSDSLYYAEEDVWLADVSSNGAFRVTQHWFDGLGRETNTLTCVGTVPGAAAVAFVPDEGMGVASLGWTTYGVGNRDSAERAALSETRDTRGRVVATERVGRCDADETIVRTGSAEYYPYLVQIETTTALRNGETKTHRYADGRSTATAHRTEWDADGLRVEVDSMVLDTGETVTNAVVRHDALGRIASVWRPLGVTTHVYDGASSRIMSSTETAPDGTVRVVEFLYDALGEQVATVRDGVTNTADVAYEAVDGVHWRVTTHCVLGPGPGGGTNSVLVSRERLTGLSDALRACTVTVGADGIATTNTVSYDPSTGLETAMTASSVLSPTTTRSRYGLPVEVEEDGETTFHTYDAFGRVVRVERTSGDGLVPVSEFGYDTVGDLVRTSVFTNGTGTADTFYGYDWKGRRVLEEDASGAVVQADYTHDDTLFHRWGAAYELHEDRDGRGNRTALFTTRETDTCDDYIWDTQWDETWWDYDASTGLCTSKTYADGTGAAYTYTGPGLPLRTTDASGRWRECVRDARGYLVGMAYSSPDMGYGIERDAYGMPIRTWDVSGNAWLYAYAVGSVLTNEVQATGGRTNVLARSVDAFGRPTGYALAVDGAAQGGVGYAYDARNRVCAVVATNSSGRSFAVDYTNGAGYNYGHVVTLPGGGTLRRTVGRDPFRRGLVTACRTDFGGRQVDAWTYAYDALGRPVSRNGDTFAYNDRGEVVRAVVGGTVFAHAYDGAGNHVVSGEGAVTNTVANNALNQTTAFGGASVAWNADGGMASDDRWLYAYDAEDRLVSATSASPTNGALRVRSAYDYLGRRISKTVERCGADVGAWTMAERRRFVWDGWNLVHESAETVEGAATNVVEMQFFWGPDLSGTLQGAGGVGGLLAVSRGGSFLFPTYDGYGNVSKYVDESGAVVAAYAYDDFGNVVSRSGPMAGDLPVGFSTKYRDDETGLVYYGRRFYSPAYRCWTSRDPIGEAGGENLYAFCGNRAISLYDTLGMAPSKEWNTIIPDEGLFLEALWDFLNGGDFKIYKYEYPDSATMRLLTHPSVSDIWNEFKNVRYQRGGTNSKKRYSIRYEARFKDFLIDVVTALGFGKTVTGKYDFGVNVLGSFNGNATISVNVQRCEKKLEMMIKNTFSVESMFRNPVTRVPMITTPFLSPVVQYFIYDITEVLQ